MAHTVTWCGQAIERAARSATLKTYEEKPAMVLAIGKAKEPALLVNRKSGF